MPRIFADYEKYKKKTTLTASNRDSFRKKISIQTFECIYNRENGLERETGRTDLPHHLLESVVDVHPGKVGRTLRRLSELAPEAAPRVGVDEESETRAESTCGPAARRGTSGHIGFNIRTVRPENDPRGCRCKCYFWILWIFIQLWCIMEVWEGLGWRWKGWCFFAAWLNSIDCLVLWLIGIKVKSVVYSSI